SSISDYPTPRSISLLARAISAGKKNPLNTPRCSPAGGTEPMRRRKAKSTNERTRSVNMTTTDILTDMVLVPLHRGFDRLNLSLKVARAAVWDQRAVRCCGLFLAAFGSSPPVRASAASDEPRVG